MFWNPADPNYKNYLVKNKRPQTGLLHNNKSRLRKRKNPSFHDNDGVAFNLFNAHKQYEQQRNQIQDLTNTTHRNPIVELQTPENEERTISLDVSHEKLQKALNNQRTSIKNVNQMQVKIMRKQSNVDRLNRVLVGTNLIQNRPSMI